MTKPRSPTEQLIELSYALFDAKGVGRELFRGGEMFGGCGAELLGLASETIGLRSGRVEERRRVGEG